MSASIIKPGAPARPARPQPAASKPLQPHPGGGLLSLTIVDRYLLRQFVQTFLICFCSLTGLYIVVDAFNNLEEFITYGKDHGGVLRVLADYYMYRAISFFDTTSNVITLVAAMFTVTWITRHNEMTALEAAGIPRARVMKPVIMAAVVIFCVSAGIREFVIPAVREQLSHNAQDLGGSRGKPLVPRYDFETGVLFRAQAPTYADQKRIAKPDFQLPAGLDVYGTRLTAENAFYHGASPDRPGGYLLQQVESPPGLDGVASLRLEGHPILLTPKDTPWLKPGECFVVSDVSFEYLAADSNWRQLSSTYDLIRGLRNRSLDYGANERMAIHGRIVKIPLDLTLLFLGLPLILGRSNRNVFLAIGMCMALVVTFMLVVLGCNYLGASYWLEPSLAAWLPLMIFVPAAVAMSQPLRE